jgi:hypothetical protein
VERSTPISLKKRFHFYYTKLLYMHTKARGLKTTPYLPILYAAYAVALTTFWQMDLAWRPNRLASTFSLPDPLILVVWMHEGKRLLRTYVVILYSTFNGLTSPKTMNRKILKKKYSELTTGKCYIGQNFLSLI